MTKKLSAEEVEEVDPSLAEQEKEKKKNKSRKVIVTTTYFITILCLLAGLLVPLFNCVEGVELPERMMLRYIPAMFNGIFGRAIIPIPEGGWFFSYEKIIDIIPEFLTAGTFSFISLVSVLYAVVCILSLVMLIPVFLGSKKKNTSGNSALLVEILALIVLLSYIAERTWGLLNSPETLVWSDFNFLIPLGGVLLMAIIQTVATKGSIGVSKIFAVIFSTIGLVALLDVTLFIPALSGGLNSLSAMLQSGDKANFIGGLFTDSPQGQFGIHGIISLFSIMQSFASLGEFGSALYIVLYVIWILIAVFTALNFVFDIIGLGTGKLFNKDHTPAKNAFSNTFAIVRYVLTLVLVGAAIAFAIMLEGVTAGIYLYLLAVILFISLINAIARTIAASSRCKKYAVAPAEEPTEKVNLVDNSFDKQEEPVYVEHYEETYDAPVVTVIADEEPSVEEEPAYEEPAPVEEYVAPVQEAEPVDDGQPLDYTQPLEYTPVPEESLFSDSLIPAEPEPEEDEKPEPSTVYVYGGDTDEFMETLTDAEKIEFVEIFIKRSKGTVNGVPAYVIHDDNSDFFPAVFVHINRYRNIASDSLMQKMYKQLGKVM